MSSLEHHEHAPLILDHPSVRPLIVEISDEEFRTGHLNAIPPPPIAPTFGEEPAPRPRRHLHAVVTIAIAVLFVISISARTAVRARETRHPAAANAATTTALASWKAVAPAAPSIVPAAPIPTVEAEPAVVIVSLRPLP